MVEATAPRALGWSELSLARVTGASGRQCNIGRKLANAILKYRVPIRLEINDAADDSSHPLPNSCGESPRNSAVPLFTTCGEVHAQAARPQPTVHEPLPGDGDSPYLHSRWEKQLGHILIPFQPIPTHTPFLSGHSPQRIFICCGADCEMANRSRGERGRGVE